MKYKIIIIGFVALLVLVGLVAFFVGKKDPENQLKGNLEIWSFEDRLVWRDVISSFEDLNRGLKITYQQKNKETYEVELINALAAGNGPDIFFIHNTWLQKHADKLFPFPENIASVNNFSLTFVDVTTKDLVRGNFVYALPLYVDSLALYYNKDIFNSSGVALPPKTWEEFNDIVRKTTQLDKSGVLIRPGASIGTANNIESASDILTAIMFQTGTQMIQTKGGVSAVFDETVNFEGVRYSPGEESLTFYTDFANPTKTIYTWNRGLTDSLDLFTDGGLAMYFGYSKDIPIVSRSNINFGIAPLPQIKDKFKDPSYKDINYADYWAAAVNKATPESRESFEFLSFLVSQSNLLNFLEKAGLPSARRDLIGTQSSNSNLKVFAEQALIASSWPQPDNTKVKEIFNKMIENVVLNKSLVKDAIAEAANNITNLFREAN